MTPDTVLKIAAFTRTTTDADGGNPAGVVFADSWPSEAAMLAVAKAVGYSETAFAVPDQSGGGWRVRYFAPRQEVPFCGHATIALGAALAVKRFSLTLRMAAKESKQRQRVKEGGAEETDTVAILQALGLSSVSEVALPNVGREAHAYLHHIGPPHRIDPAKPPSSAHSLAAP